MPDHLTDDEFERLLALDDAEETGDPFLRRGPYGTEGKPFIPNPPEIQRPIRRRLVGFRGGLQQAHQPIPSCGTCHHPRHLCICQLDI